jgi:hypothetical protein
MQLRSIDKRSGLSRKEFKEEYLDQHKPVILTDFASDWPAKEKWTFDYLRDTYGDIKVPLFDKSFSEPGKSYMSPSQTMRFGDYLTLIENEPTDLRMFLFNIFKHAPELVGDVGTPTIMDGFLNEFPFMFFGGQGSSVKMHYDIDCSNVFLTQFQTRKKVTLFSPKQSKYLYHLPFTVASMVDMNQPDVDKYPALAKVEGWEGIIGHGETIFIPSMYWHFIEYVDGGFSLALRSSESVTNRLKGALNIARHFVVDRGMNMVLGTKWHEIKKDLAYKRARA